MITKAIVNCLNNVQERKWERTYWAFDIHGTILKPNYRRDDIATEFYPQAKEVMQRLSKREGIVRRFTDMTAMVCLSQFMKKCS